MCENFSLKSVKSWLIKFSNFYPSTISTSLRISIIWLLPSSKFSSSSSSSNETSPSLFSVRRLWVDLLTPPWVVVLYRMVSPSKALRSSSSPRKLGRPEGSGGVRAFDGSSFNRGVFLESPLSMVPRSLAEEAKDFRFG